MASDRLLSSRFEMKYVIPETQATRVREFVRSYMALDEYGVGRPNFSYPVHSLYLDSDTLKLYWQTINGEKNRFKLRVRFYNDDPTAPVFLEIKRRQNHCIIKHRAAIWRHALFDVLAGGPPRPDTFAAYSPKQEAALNEFVGLMQSLNATPRAHVAYLREAYLPADGNSARVTLDRSVRIQPQFGSHVSTQMPEAKPIWGAPVILELKFTNRYPLWFREMVEACGLVKGSAAKYVAGIELLGEDRFSRRVANSESANDSIHSAPPASDTPAARLHAAA